MLIFNKNLAVAPLTTHIPLYQVSKKISKIISTNYYSTEISDDLVVEIIVKDYMENH